MDDIGEYLMPNQSLRKAIRDIRSETGIGWDVIGKTMYCRGCFLEYQT